uniref:uncharacterized protein LOC117607511 n=1 Tax=Osmia lignaria TaxID=473952 RepID=UPI0014782A13|nr:uncharacterized protein LOC117607511 [Osmia lignaria]
MEGHKGYRVETRKALKDNKVDLHTLAVAIRLWGVSLCSTTVLTAVPDQQEGCGILCMYRVILSLVFSKEMPPHHYEWTQALFYHRVNTAVVHVMDNAGSWYRTQCLPLRWLTPPFSLERCRALMVCKYVANEKYHHHKCLE